MSPPVAAVQTADPVETLIRSIRIPPRPSLLISMQQELDSAEPSQQEIARIISSDVAMSAALLKLANSSIYGRRTVKSIDQALLFLGLNQVASLMTGLLARQAIPADNAALANFWDISSRRAQAMLFLSRRLRMGEPDVAHTFGLFCDTGVPLMIARFTDYPATHASASLDTQRPVTAQEDERHSTNHAAIGCLLARNWGLSSEVAWAILHHHDYSVLDDAAGGEPVRALVAMSLLAEVAIQKYQGHGGSVEWDKGGERACAYLGLTSQETGELLDELLECLHAEE